MKKSKAIVKAKPKKAAKKKILPVLVNFILDKSGSMGDVLEETISGFNNYVDTLRKDKKSTYLFTLTLFDTLSVDMPYVAVPLEKVQPLTKENYIPGQLTPLFDAVGNTISLVDKNGMAKNTSATLTVLMTDGEENASKEWTHERVTKLVADKEKDPNWTFICLAASLDAKAVGASVGASAANSRHYSSHNTRNTMVAAAGSTVAYAATMSSPLSSASAKNLMKQDFYMATGYADPEEENKDTSSIYQQALDDAKKKQANP